MGSGNIELKKTICFREKNVCRNLWVNLIAGNLVNLAAVLGCSPLMSRLLIMSAVYSNYRQ